MDKFEIEADSIEMAEALVDMIDLVGTLARKYNVCPTCLTFVFADSISRLVEEGKLGHVDGNTTHAGETVQ